MRTQYEKILSYIIVAVTFLFMQPFITWNSYPLYSFCLYLEYFLLVLGILLVFFMIFNDNGIVHKKNFRSFIIFLALSFAFYFNGENSQVGQWGVLLQYLFLSLLMFVDEDIIEDSLNKLALLMAILLIPALIVLLFRYAGINVPHSILSDYREGNRVFVHYPFSIATSNVYSTSIASFRLNGMFDEPGALGTYLVLILIARNYNLKDRTNVILFISGCFTMSTAFILISLIYTVLIIFKRIQHNKKVSFRRNAFWGCLLIVIFIIVFCVLNPSILENTWLRVFSKFYSDEYLRGSSGIISKIQSEFEGNLKLIMFGKGYSTPDFIDSGSALILFYKVGVIGVLLTVIYIIYNQKPLARNGKDTIVRIALFLALLQRPYVLMVPYVVLFLMGIESKNILSTEEKIQ